MSRCRSHEKCLVSKCYRDSHAIMSIRLDIIEAMGVLSQIVGKFQQAHWVARAYFPLFQNHD